MATMTDQELEVIASSGSLKRISQPIRIRAFIVFLHYKKGNLSALKKTTQRDR